MPSIWALRRWPNRALGAPSTGSTHSVLGTCGTRPTAKHSPSSSTSSTAYYSRPIGVLARRRPPTGGASPSAVMANKPALSTCVTAPIPASHSILISRTATRRFTPRSSAQPCAMRRHVLDGLLYHESDIRIQEHSTDTLGFTDHVFFLCSAYGFRFAPGSVISGTGACMYRTAAVPPHARTVHCRADSRTAHSRPVE